MIAFEQEEVWILFKSADSIKPMAFAIPHYDDCFILHGFVHEEATILLRWKSKVIMCVSVAAKSWTITWIQPHCPHS